MLKLTPVFLFLLVSISAHSREVDRTVVLVNGDVVLKSDVNALKKNFSLRREIDPFVGITSFSPDAAKEKEIIDYLIQERLVMQKYPATEDEIEEEINAVQRSNRIDRDHLKEVLKGQGVKFEDYRRIMGVSVTKRKLIERDLRPLAAISDEDVKNHYYTDNAYLNRRKESKLTLSYTLQQMLLPNQAVMQTAEKRLKAGEDFDSVASDLAGRGVESSRLGTISEENMNSKIHEAVQGLKVGESTSPLSTGSGYMILRVLEIGAPKDPSFERDRERIRNELFQKALINQLRLWTEREKAASYIHLPK